MIDNTNTGYGMTLRNKKRTLPPGRPKIPLTQKKEPKYKLESTTYKTSARTRALNAKAKRKQRGKAKRAIKVSDTFFFNDSMIRRELPRDLFQKLIIMTEYELRGIKTYERDLFGGGRRLDKRRIKSFSYEKNAAEIVKYATERYLANLIYDSAAIAKFSRGRNRITWGDLVAVNNIYKRNGLPFTYGKLEENNFYRGLKNTSNAKKKILYEMIMEGDRKVFDWDTYDMVGEQYRVRHGQNTMDRKPPKKKKNRAREQAIAEEKKLKEMNEKFKKMQEEKNKRPRTIMDISPIEQEILFEGQPVGHTRSGRRFHTFGDEDVQQSRSHHAGRMALEDMDEEYLDDVFNTWGRK